MEILEMFFFCLASLAFTYCPEADVKWVVPPMGRGWKLGNPGEGEPPMGFMGISEWGGRFGEIQWGSCMEVSHRPPLRKLEFHQRPLV